MDYELYHDESKKLGYWHGILMVPVHTKSTLLEYLSATRDNTTYCYPLSIKNIRRNTGKIYDCAESWVQLGVVSLVSQRKGPPEGLFLGRRVGGRKQYVQFRETIGCKFILFREKDDHTRMIGYHDYGSKVETTFRMGLKGGLHFLGNEESPINIVGMHFDGYKHYHRHIDHDRIVGRLYGLRDYCSIAECDDLIDDRTGDHTRAGCQEWEDCQLLQLADLMVGCFRAVLTSGVKPVHAQLAAPVKAIVKRYGEGYARMQNSRWRNSFCMSQCYLDSRQWRFETIDYQEGAKDLQPGLPLG